MRAFVGREGMDRPAASSSEMGRFETEWLATEANLVALTDLSGAWIDRVHRRRPLDGIILDIDSSESPTWGAQEGAAWNGHFRCTCYHPLFVFNQFGTSSGARSGPVTCTASRAGVRCSSPSSPATVTRASISTSAATRRSPSP